MASSLFHASATDYWAVGQTNDPSIVLVVPAVMWLEFGVARSPVT
jgi:hypothetical protein